MENIELKGKIESLEHARKVCEQIGAEFEWQRLQQDIYYAIGDERLKLRIADNEPRYLVHYLRPSTESARKCESRILRLENCCHSDARSFFNTALKPCAQVVKTRQLFMWQGVRIHLDSVKGLGDFIEFEHPIGKYTREEAKARTLSLVALFGIRESDIVLGSYSDMV